MKDETIIGIDSSLEEKLRNALIRATGTRRKRIFSKICAAALGSIPWVGGFLSALSEFKNTEQQVKVNELHLQWMTEHSSKIRELTSVITQTIVRLDEFPEEIDERLEDEEYLQIVRKSFRAWDAADTQEKRDFVRKLLTNAGAYKLVPDDLIRLFIDWINLYHEVHFAVIRCVHQYPGATRNHIWKQLQGSPVREDSLEADLFKLLIRDLSTGSVIRQHRPTDYQGNFFKKQRTKSGATTGTLKSAFDNEDRYELTELGKQFVHYTMNEVVVRVN